MSVHGRGVGLGLLAIGLAVAGVGARSAEAAPIPVMVLYFDNDTGNSEYDSLAKGLADMMITDLAAVPSLRIVEREKLEALLRELKLQRKRYFDPKTAQRIGKGTGAAYAVTGSFLSIDPNIRLDVRMVKIDTAVVVKSATVTGTKDKFFELQQQLAGKMIEGLAGLLSPGDAAKASAAASANKVDDLSVVLTYSKGLDASDRGDLDGASKQLQKVVAASPDFKLGKDRYRQIMKALYDAKDVRTSLLSTSERTLLDHSQAALAKGGADAANERLSYRILLGQYYLTKVAAAVKEGRPAAEYREQLRAHVDNQLKLFEETKSVEEVDWSNYLESGDVKLAEELGISGPGSPFAFRQQPSEAMHQLGKLLIDNDPSVFAATIPGRDVACFYKLDPVYSKMIPKIYEQSLAHRARFDDQYKERDTMRLLRDFGRALAILGRPEEAIAKLQGGLDRYPKAEEFASVEAEIREILGAGLKPHCK